jgi:putative phage-type endonuclease
MEQRSDEWFAARVGKVTASRVSDVVARTKSGYGASRANYMAELLIERITGRPTEKFSSPAMVWGTETEEQARSEFEGTTGLLVLETGFVPHPFIVGSGASPDGLIGDDGLVEIKCPNSATHIETILSETVPEKYVTQMMWQMACTGRQWCDFVSFDPRMPHPEMRLIVMRVKRDQQRIAALESEVIKFLAELDEKVAKFNEKYGKDK